jgi:predicted DsbA family dithiol-disulfide isomerase
MLACLSDSLDISDHRVLASLAGEVGINESEIVGILESDAYNDQVLADIEEGQRLNITGVPFFVFNDKYTISGAQSEQVFIKVLSMILEEEHETVNFRVDSQSKSEGYCTDGFCRV